MRSTLVCFALEAEASPFRRALADRTGVSVLITGIGQENARVALERALLRGSFELVLTCGFAGGLNAGLKLGEVVFFTEDARLTLALSGAGVRPAKFHCAPRMVVTASAKAELHRTTGADAVEMESAVVQTICRERGIPCATVRVISDTAGEDLPLDFNQMAKADQNLDYGKLVCAVARAPGKIPALLRLQKQTRLAAKALAKQLDRLISGN